jgi:hypothetical protein
MTGGISETNLKERAARQFLAACGDDTFPEELWRLLTIIRYVATGEDDFLTDSDVIDPAFVRKMAFEIMGDLLRAGQLRAWFTNYPVTDTYCLKPARGSVSQILERIASEWDALQHEPSMCEIVAFSATDEDAANKALNPTGNKPAR